MVLCAIFPSYPILIAHRSGATESKGHQEIYSGPLNCWLVLFEVIKIDFGRQDWLTKERLSFHSRPSMTGSNLSLRKNARDFRLIEEICQKNFYKIFIDTYLLSFLKANNCISVIMLVQYCLLNRTGSHMNSTQYTKRIYYYRDYITKRTVQYFLIKYFQSSQTLHSDH